MEIITINQNGNYNNKSEWKLKQKTRKEIKTIKLEWKYKQETE